jgi:peptidoglycan hydrolase-like protein with peptidoglycan-binding domain
MLKKKAQHSVDRRSSALLPALICAVVALALAAGGFVLISGRHHARPASSVRSALAAGPTDSTVPGTTDPPGPLSVVGVTPRDGAHGVGFDPDITISFSVPVAADGVLPRLSPAPPGKWSWATPEKLVFHPAGYFAPFSRVRLTLASGPHGFSSKAGALLRTTVTSSFVIRAASTLRLQQLLAELGYLPVSFTPVSGSAPTPGVTTQADVTSVGVGATASTTKAADQTTSSLPAGPPANGVTPLRPAPPPQLTTVKEPSVPGAIPLTPVAGSFAWRFGHIPPSLAVLWSPGKINKITTGAVMQFEMAEGLPADGEAGRLAWADLLRAVADRQLDRSTYNYVYVNTGSPEYVSLWRDGAVVFKTLANTGIAQAPTEVGTWPVYARYVTTTMSGTNPDGSHYNDPGIPWVSYFNGGDALHGFLRAAYGFPQSLGCVEMPYASARTVFPYTPIGTLVTVL